MKTLHNFKITLGATEKSAPKTMVIKAKDWHHAFALCMAAIANAERRAALGGDPVWNGQVMTVERV